MVKMGTLKRAQTINSTKKMKNSSEAHANEWFAICEARAKEARRRSIEDVAIYLISFGLVAAFFLTR
jgi:hypothetical protein